MSCGLNLNIQTCGIDFFFFLTYTEKGGEGKIKEERREIGQESEGDKRKRIILNTWLKLRSSGPVLC